MARTGQADEAGRLHARVDVAGSGEARAVTGLPVLDHLLVLFAEYASFDLVLEIAPGEAEAEVAAAGRALGRALADPLRQKRCRGHGSAAVPADEALAHVAVEASGRPLVVSNVDLSDARVAGLASDIVATFPDKSTELILYCGGGYRSALAADNLQKMGYTNVFSMAGGWRAWNEAGGDIET